MDSMGGAALVLSVLVYHDGMNPRWVLAALAALAFGAAVAVLARGSSFTLVEAEILLLVRVVIIAALTAGTRVDLLAFSNGMALPMVGVYCGWFLSRRGLLTLTAGTLAWVIAIAAHGDGVLTSGAITVAVQAPVVAWAVRVLQQRQQRLLRTDPLTGVLNRHGLMEDAERLLRAADRRGWPLALAMIDLDDLRTVNNSQGHPAGDDLLLRATQEWARALGGAATIGRFGGDEFVLLFPGLTGADAEDRLAALAQESTVQWTAGVADYLPGEPFSDLLERADRVMYERKDALGVWQALRS